MVTCSVTPYHLLFTEEDLKDYDTNLKVNPPLRSVADREALQQAVYDGTVDCIASHHQPHEKDSKVVEFEYARNGMTSLETAFCAVCTALPELTNERLVQLFGTHSRQVFGLPPASISENSPAVLTLFSRNGQTVVDLRSRKSRSANTPFAGRTLSGKVYGIINKGQLVLNQ
jgi:dihydroorotase